MTSTQESLGKVKVSKFQAFLKHKNLPNRLFNACAHGEVITQKVWMSKGTKASLAAALYVDLIMLTKRLAYRTT